MLLVVVVMAKQQQEQQHQHLHSTQRHDWNLLALLTAPPLQVHSC
jgi:hypothetical protein